MVGREIERLPTTRKVVALTFDCGGDDAGVAAILRALAAAHAPATFFLTGDWAEAYPARARAIARTYPIGNHSLRHAHLTALSAAAVARDVVAARAAIRADTGAEPRPRFRFPYGESSQRLIDVVNSLGYGAFRWTVDTLGWQGRSAGRSAASVRARVLDALAPGEIVLMHVGSSEDGSTLDADALPLLLRAVTQRGYGFVVLP
jgi:peptidoglycan/xylan/chitin deacetylase (PgdA/CDA1 family)